MEDERCDNSNWGRLAVVKAPFDGGERVKVVADRCGVALVEVPFDGSERVEADRCGVALVEAPFDSGERVEAVVDSCGVTLVEAPFDGDESVEVVDRFGVISTGIIEGEKGDDGVLNAWRPDD